MGLNTQNLFKIKFNGTVIINPQKGAIYFDIYIISININNNKFPITNPEKAYAI
jgi:hypothetical protein